MSGSSIHKIVIVGSGNLAFHLAEAFQLAGKEIVAVVARNETEGKTLAQKVSATYISNAQNCPAADLIVLAVSDSAIPEVSKHFSHHQAIVVHISGATAMDALVNEQHGVFYPLQSFTKGKPVNFRETPFLIEGNSPDVARQLTGLGQNISNQVYPASSLDRRYLHLAAVFASNFSNALYGVAEKLMNKNTTLPFSILHPLIQETALKIQQLAPKAAQTGPARRGDEQIMKAQLELLKDQAELQDIYQAISKLIQQNYA